MAELRLEAITKSFGPTTAVDALDLHVTDGELLTLLGPSGSGKTTALRVVAGFTPPTSGLVRIGSRDVTALPPEKRDVGMVFQSYALFPHRDVFHNVAFGLERRKLARETIRERVGRALSLVHLSELSERRPDALSGGQQQRVALARALVIEPTVLLLDEPLSNLDASLRLELRTEIRRIQRALGITTLLVTHDQEEALSISDRIAVLSGGCLQQLGSPDELYRKPCNRFVAEFIGKMNVLAADALATGRYRVAGTEIRAQHANAPEGAAHDSLRIAIRPESVELGAHDGWNRLAGRVSRRIFLGELTEIGVTLDDGSEIMLRGTSLAATLGEDVDVSWPVEATQLLFE